MMVCAIGMNAKKSLLLRVEHLVRNVLILGDYLMEIATNALLI